MVDPCHGRGLENPVISRAKPSVVSTCLGPHMVVNRVGETRLNLINPGRSKRQKRPRSTQTHQPNGQKTPESVGSGEGRAMLTDQASNM